MMSEQLEIEIVDKIESVLSRYMDDYLTSAASEDVFDDIFEYLKEDL